MNYKHILESSKQETLAKDIAKDLIDAFKTNIHLNKFFPVETKLSFRGTEFSFVAGTHPNWSCCIPGESKKSGIAIQLLFDEDDPEDDYKGHGLHFRIDEINVQDDLKKKGVGSLLVSIALSVARKYKITYIRVHHDWSENEDGDSWWERIVDRFPQFEWNLN
jgi:hypothetical protein